MLDEKIVKVLRLVLSRIDSWLFDTTGRVDVAPKLQDEDLQSIRITQGEMAVIRQVAFCLRPPSLHDHSIVMGLSNQVLAGKQTEDVPAESHTLSMSSSRRPVAIVAVGGPGCGKDYVLLHRENCCCDYLRKFDGPPKDQYVVVDPDFWVSSLCQNKNEHRDLANFLNLEHFFYAVSRRNHVVFNGTGKDIRNTAGRVISRLREADYRIFFCIVLSRFDVVMGRIAARARQTGRDVPEDIVKASFKSLSEAVPLYLKNQASMVEALLVYSNNGDEPSADPKFILSDGKDPADAIKFAKETLAVPKPV
jgi:predicted ABC-type ATPase